MTKWKRQTAVAFPRVYSSVSAWLMMFQPVIVFVRSLNSWVNNSRVQVFFCYSVSVFMFVIHLLQKTLTGCTRAFMIKKKTSDMKQYETWGEVTVSPDILETSHTAERQVSLQGERMPTVWLQHPLTICPSLSSFLSPLLLLVQFVSHSRQS